MKASLRYLALATAFVAAHFPATLNAQVDDWTGAVSTSFADDDNWSLEVFPFPVFVEFARIGANTGSPGVPSDPVATVTTDLSSTPASTLILGDGGGFQGTLDISNNGHLVLQPGFGMPSGDLDVGRNGGVGILNLSGTGHIDITDSLRSGGGAASTITLADSATVMATEASLDRNLRIVGSGVSFTASSNVALGASGTHEWEFDPASGPSPLLVGGEISLDGTLKLDSLGQPLAVGASYTIADSSSVSGGFPSVDLSEVTALGLGVSARATSVADGGSVNGVLTSVVIEQQPVLVVNRQTGETSIRNPGSTTSVAFDAYVVGSGFGGLDPAGWDSISPDGGWDQANPTTTAISELNPLSSQALVGEETISLGTIFDAAERDFDDDAEDVTFRFAPNGQGFTEGVVVYEGIPTDTLTLNVDRTTGAAQLINGFRDAVSIDTYLISSESESLAVSPGGWETLGGDWQVGVNEAGRVSELNPLASLDLDSNDAVSLGDLYAFNAGSASEDLVFQFTLPTESFFRTGKVVFADELTVLSAGLAADFNGDGRVDLLDLDILGSNFGAIGVGMGQGDANGDGSVDLLDLDILGSTFGQSSTAFAIPEPAAGFMVVWAGLLGFTRGRARSL